MLRRSFLFSALALGALLAFDAGHVFAAVGLLVAFAVLVVFPEMLNALRDFAHKVFRGFDPGGHGHAPSRWLTRNEKQVAIIWSTMKRLAADLWHRLGHRRGHLLSTAPS